MKKPLTPKILTDPNHEFVKTLIYIYSMQSFVFEELNKASRYKKEEFIPMFGPFAAALGFIVHNGNIESKMKIRFFQRSNKQVTKTYRGLIVKESELDEKYRVGETTKLLGFTSTSLNKEEAIKFAFEEQTILFQMDRRKMPLLFVIEFVGDRQLFKL